MLNILMTFCSVLNGNISERTKDKLSASKRRAIHCPCSYGYKALTQSVIVPESGACKAYFSKYMKFSAENNSAAELNAEVVNQDCKPWTTAAVYRF